ncbi:SPRY domain-containing protein [Toxoplasma gondii ME49]|uniref:SPRY domain-containing protein n=8 Tax=Toxoplasma gondii TaxID=5811 RepID=A0A0F7UMU3_TOXGV|nr:SPRY domain-containing protein [Toxoplasma gondii ME49]EPR57670.1 SPRY domain-containing protein [Toxoplasma gondii GT1]ESS29344.1 SPRY domain-containing protein [Toxoplasma gondii VEG]KAF4646058.1 SPRY domain-containing protein [Toxoplasma gondii]CAJ20459.1 spry domain containing protein, putative [Toxoplasma gondii RH]EPT32697.1 SPRY domain-containing protein [Toxoplasma gondii ME49]|eukprot:XP_002370118.1 SPRY domain-containing protein [Toxoplasma gondii ME49]
MTQTPSGRGRSFSSSSSSSSSSSLSCESSSPPLCGKDQGAPATFLDGVSRLLFWRPSSGPLALNCRRHPHYVRILRDGLTALYAGRGDYTDVGVVQAEKPAATTCAVYYFEVQILSASSPPHICVGFTTKSAALTKHPGVEPHSVGYRAEDGRKLVASASASSLSRGGVLPGEAFSSPYGAGDVVGCGIHYLSKKIFFTKNGVCLGVAGKADARVQYLPSAGMHGADERVKFNFTGPFAFDLKAMLQCDLVEERQRIKADLERDARLAALVSPASLTEVVRSYLLHAAFSRTLAAFERALTKRDKGETRKNDEENGEGRETEAGERALEERAVEERAVEERAVEERAVEERAVEERAVEERAVEERTCTQMEISVAEEGNPEGLGEGEEARIRRTIGRGQGQEVARDEERVESSMRTEETDAEAKSSGASRLEPSSAEAAAAGGSTRRTALSISFRPSSWVAASPLAAAQLSAAFWRNDKEEGEELSMREEASEREDEVCSASLCDRTPSVHTTTESTSILLASLTKRKELKQAIVEGRSDAAAEILETSFPAIFSTKNEDFQDSSFALSLLYTQQLIDLLRPPQRAVSAAISWMREKIAPLLQDASPHVRQAVTECCGLLAYAEPERSSLAAFFDLNRRTVVATAVNRCVLRHHFQISCWSPLEILVRHLIACRQLLREASGNRGPVPSPSLFCYPPPMRLLLQPSEAKLAGQNSENGPPLIADDGDEDLGELPLLYSP